MTVGWVPLPSVCVKNPDRCAQKYGSAAEIVSLPWSIWLHPCSGNHLHEPQRCGMELWRSCDTVRWHGGMGWGWPQWSWRSLLTLLILWSCRNLLQFHFSTEDVWKGCALDVFLGDAASWVFTDHHCCQRYCRDGSSSAVQPVQHTRTAWETNRAGLWDACDRAFIWASCSCEKLNCITQESSRRPPRFKWYGLNIEIRNKRIQELVWQIHSNLTPLYIHVYILFNSNFDLGYSVFCINTM